MSEITPRVALVDDDDDLRAATAQWLSLAGFTVDSFAAAPRFSRMLLTSVVI